MSKRSEEIAAQIKASREEAARVAEQFKQDQIALNEKLSVQNVYDTYVAGTQNVANGTNTHTQEGEYPVVVSDMGRTNEGTPYARFVKTFGDPKYDDDYSVTNTYIVPNGEKVSIAIVNSFNFAESFRVYSYDTQKEDSELILSTKRGEPAPDEFTSVYNLVEGAINLNTQSVEPNE